MESRHMILVVNQKPRIADETLFELRSPSGDDLHLFTRCSHISVTTPDRRRWRHDGEDHDRYVITIPQGESDRSGSQPMRDDVTVNLPANDLEMLSSWRSPRRVFRSHPRPLA